MLCTVKVTSLCFKLDTKVHLLGGDRYEGGKSYNYFTNFLFFLRTVGYGKVASHKFGLLFLKKTVGSETHESLLKYFINFNTIQILPLLGRRGAFKLHFYNLNSNLPSADCPVQLNMKLSTQLRITKIITKFMENHKCQKIFFVKCFQKCLTARSTFQKRI